MLDSLNKPTVIHRIVGATVQANGQVLYTTKGDNNKVNDPGVVAADHVVGYTCSCDSKTWNCTAFYRFCFGACGYDRGITIFYLGSYESKIKDDKQKESFPWRAGTYDC